MIPLIKVVSLLFRVFSKPLINYSKQYHSTNEIKSGRLRRFFILLGNKYHKFQNFINRRYMKVNNQFAYKPLNDNIAIEKGIQFFYQIVFYSIVIGFPVYQMYVASQQSKQKSQTLNQRIKNIDNKSKQLKDKIQNLVNQKKQRQKTQSNPSNYPLRALNINKFIQNLSYIQINEPIRLFYSPNIGKQFRFALI